MGVRDHLSNGKNQACERHRITDKERRGPAITVEEESHEGAKRKEGDEQQ